MDSSSCACKLWIVPVVATTSLSRQDTCRRTENGGGAIFCLPVFPLTEVDGGSQVVDVGDEDELLALLQEPFQESTPLERVVDISVTRRVPAPATGTDIYSENQNLF